MTTKTVAKIADTDQTVILTANQAAALDQLINLDGPEPYLLLGHVVGREWHIIITADTLRDIDDVVAEWEADNEAEAAEAQAAYTDANPEPSAWWADR